MKNKIISILLLINFCIYFVILFISINQFWVGFHNIDYNFKNPNLRDIGTDGVIRTLDEAYLMGLRQIQRGFYFSVLSSFVIGITIFKIIRLIK